MLHTLKGNGFDSLLTLVSIKMEHPQPLHVCNNVCIINAYTGAGLIRVLKEAIVLSTHRWMCVCAKFAAFLPLTYILKADPVSQKGSQTRVGHVS